VSETIQEAGGLWRTHRRTILNVADRLGPLLSLGVVVAFFAWRGSNFLTWGNGLNIGVQTAVFGILALGETFVIIAGGIDLSVGAVTALAGVVAAVTMKSGHSPLEGILAGLAVGGGVGLTNGLISAYGKLPSFVVTLGTMLIARGLALSVAGGVNISGLPDAFTNCMGGTFYIGGKTAEAVGTWREVREPVLILLVAALGAHLLLSRTRMGRYTYAMGSNAEATRLSGVNIRAYQTAIFTLMGLLAGLAGLVQATRISAGSPTTAEWYELSAIAATVIGGTSLMGGEGGIAGTLIGALMLGVVANGLDLCNADPYWQKIATGAIIVFAVFLDRLRARARKSLQE